MFNETPPLDSFYGRSGGDRTRIFGGAKGRNLRVLCSNLAVLSGDRGALRTYLPTAALPGVGGIIWRILFDGSLPTAPTPWIVPRDRYRAGCRRSNGANILRIFPRAGARHLTPVRRVEGLHFADINLALGNLVRIVKSEARTYAKHR